MQLENQHNARDSETLRKSWEGHWRATDIDVAHDDVVSSSPSSNTDIYRPFVKKWLSAYEAPRVLESGCGPGQWLYFVAMESKGTAVGLDLAADTLERVAASHTLAPFIKSGRIELAQGDIRNVPLPSNTFDLIFSFGVIEHVKTADSQLAVNEFFRLLKPGGRALITTPNVWSMHTITRPLSQAFGSWTVGFERSISPRGLCRYAENAGLHVDEYGVLTTGQLFGSALSSRVPGLVSLSRRIESRQKRLGFLSFCIAKKS